MTASSWPEPRAYGLPGTRWASLVRGGYGAALICMPGRLIQARTGHPPSRRARAIGRVLGARHLVQAVICAAAPSRWLIGAGATVDLLHAASMAVLAGEDAELRPALLTDAAIATAFAAAGGASLRAQAPD